MSCQQLLRNKQSQSVGRRRRRHDSRRQFQHERLAPAPHASPALRLLPVRDIAHGPTLALFPYEQLLQLDYDASQRFGRVRRRTVRSPASQGRIADGSTTAALSTSRKPTQGAVASAEQPDVSRTDQEEENGRLVLVQLHHARKTRKVHPGKVQTPLNRDHSTVRIAQLTMYRKHSLPFR